MIFRHFSESIQNQIQPFVDKTVATEPEKVPASNFKVFPFRPGINKRRGDRQVIDRFVRITISTDGEFISQDHGTVSMLDRRRRRIESECRQSNASSLLERQQAGHMGSVIKQRMRHVAVQYLYAIGVEPLGNLHKIVTMTNVECV